MVTAKQTRINDEIRTAQVRVIGPDGQQLGVLPIDKAQQLAIEAEMDLVEIAPEAKPPVCRVMDYGKYLFELNKKKHAAKKNQKVIHIKEIKFRPGTEEQDYQVKLRNLIKFLTNGDKAKVTLRFRGRELAHMELGQKLLDRVEKDLEPYGTVEQFPKMEGKQMIMVLTPKKK
ncbi:MAG: translation initiation factor IF-3 [Gammaproteobacteria bacterium]|nr:translation initiation factor IF-3 [Gammaproteobacteria bacterium]